MASGGHTKMVGGLVQGAGEIPGGTEQDGP